jgi:L-iduronidase
MLSEDMHQNLALIGALPHQGIKQVRIHFLLKLISIIQENNSAINEVKHDFTLLDKFLKIIKDNGLKPGFEIMGNPSNFFNDFENNTQLYQWKDLVKQIAVRYIKQFGSEYVSHWNFESWNEPSIMFRNHYFDGIKVTPEGFLNYYDACSQGLKEANNSLIFGGPGDHWPKDIKNGPYVLDLMKHCVNGVNYFTKNKGDTKLDFISLHEKGKSGNSSFIDQQEFKALTDIENEFPTLKYKPFVENEGDPEVGWDKNRWWRADTSYAATIAQVIARRIHNFNFTNKLSLYGFDNGFLSYYPFQFTQRTLLARS